MANDELTQSGKQCRYGIVEQSTWGTAEVDGANFNVANNGLELDCENTQITRDVKRIDNPGAHGSRNMKASDVIMHSNMVMPSIPFSGIAQHDMLDMLLYAIFQDVVEVASGTAKKTFSFDAATQPDFESDLGFFMTVVERDPSASLSRKMHDAIARSLTLSWAKGEPLKYSVELVGRGLPSQVSNPSGTWTRGVMTDIWHWGKVIRMNLDFGSGNVAFRLEGFELSIPLELSQSGQDGGSPAKHQTVHIARSNPTAKLTVVKDSDFHDMLTAHSTSPGAVITGNVGIGHATPGTTDGDLDFQFYGKINGEPTLAKGEPTLTECTIECLESDDGTVPPVQVIMANSVVRGWPTS